MALKYNTKRLTAQQAAHLLRRASFGPTTALINEYTNLTPTQAVNKLLATPLVPPPPIDALTGTGFVNLPFNQENTFRHTQHLKSWWMGTMLTQQPSLLEKMTLFWQNHLVVSMNTTTDPRVVYTYHQLLRTHSLGNFRMLIIEITKNQAMLRYLNGNQNTKTKPNENYARELQELFTIGVKKPDGTANFTEDDVKAAARVLTGWTDFGFRDSVNAAYGSSFSLDRHDTADKQFSTFYQSRKIVGRTTPTAGDDELRELVDMILAQAETARNICREIYRFFVRADITSDTERNVIEELAKIFRASYDIRAVISALFRSQHFYETNQIGSILKSPIDLVLGTIRHFELPSPAPMATAAADYYSYTGYMLSRTREQQQEVLHQPTVFGWPPYYDSGFYKIWINSSTISARARFTDDLVLGYFKVNSIPIQIDTIAWARRTTNPADATALVNEITANMFAVALPQSQKDYLIDQVLNPGLSRMAWTSEWNNYMANQADPRLTRSVRGKLNNLFTFMLRMAEYQMC
jgi:uncharacterized protein (DUF1800 family)